MTFVLDNSGTQTAVISTEHILDTSTINGTYILVVRLNNMALGDIVTLRTYTITLTGGTLEVWGRATYGPWKPFNLVSISLPTPSDISFKATLQQTAGTGRAFDWKLLRI